ncbi:MAG: HD domain-containing protein [Elusimicrobia bacterium]|nr:HD domain-containing protein [Elusimicrobiota bacterium]
MKRLLDQAGRLARAPLYVVGGALRDSALGRAVADLDLAYAGDAEALARALASDSGGSLVVLDDATRVYRVALEGLQADVAALQGATIERDLERRDFGVNAMARPVLPGPGRLGPLIDPRGGLADARARVLRAAGASAFREDPIRMLRAFRLSAQLGFGIDPGTLRMIRAERRRIRACAGERVRTELLALLAVPAAHRLVRELDQVRLLTALFPELEKSRACARGYYGRGGVLRHTLDALERLDLLLERLARVLPGLEEPIRRHLEAWSGPSAGALLRLSVLLHDVAKPATARKIGGRLRFFGHDERGARLAERELARLRFSRRESDAVAACVRHHLRPGNLATNDRITPKAVYRFFRDLREDGVPLLLVCWADHASYLPAQKLRASLGVLARDPGPVPADPDKGKTVRHLRVIAALLKAYFTQAEVARPQRMLNGHEVMKTLGIPPGPAVGRILSRLSEAQATGRVKDREAALKFISRYKPKKPV